MDLSELNHVLDQLCPRLKDWLGREPLLVDADVLPFVVLGYKCPFRLILYGTRHGRSREQQGLAMAMVKLWERSVITKIAIKLGVLNTCNEMMAEKLKV
ncbi:hypothetical protein CsSME_00016213 [Camellia sinensis var. sinensis]